MSTQPERREPAYRDPNAMPAFRNPPVGTMVHWYPHADVATDEDRICAAMVTGIEGPGIVALTVYARNAAPVYKQGVRHVSDPFHIGKKENTMRSGGWDYIPDYVPDRMPTSAKRTTSTADPTKK